MAMQNGIMSDLLRHFWKKIDQEITFKEDQIVRLTQTNRQLQDKCVRLTVKAKEHEQNAIRFDEINAQLQKKLQEEQEKRKVAEEQQKKYADQATAYHSMIECQKKNAAELESKRENLQKNHHN